MRNLDDELLASTISFNVVNRQHELAKWEALAKGIGKSALYARNSSNPSASDFEKEMKRLEGSDNATSFSSGMAAISNVLFAILSPGNRIIVGKDTYGGAGHLFTRIFPKWGVVVTMVDTLDEREFEKEVSKGCDLLYLETPTNPMLKIQDIEKLSAMAHHVGAAVVIDNTVATPINQKPILLGADIVIHSATKFLGGHADALGGVACFDDKYADTIMQHKEIQGACLGPMTAYLITRGMRTLDVRMERHNQNAHDLALWLRDHPKIDAVNYPGLEGHERHDLARKQMKGFGGLLSFSLKGGENDLYKLFSRFNLAVLASTLGSVETMVGTPSTTSHVECTPRERAALGMPDGLVRCSVGLEKIDQIINDFDQALSF